MNPNLPQPTKRIAMPTPAQSAAYQQLQVSIGDIRTTVPESPLRIGIFGPEGSGKTTLPAHAKKPIFLMGRGEDGYFKLRQYDRVPAVAHFPVAPTWEYAGECLKVLENEPHDYRVLAIDTINIFEVLLFEFVCRTQFDNDMSKAGFLSFQIGYEQSMGPLRELLAQLDRIRVERKMTIVMLGHTKVKTFKNPLGPDFDRYVVDVHEKTWGVIHRWLDVVTFINFETVVTDVQKTGVGKKGKAVGGQRRIMHTERSAAWDAKNRLGLPESIDLGTHPEDSWVSFAQALREAKEASKQGEKQEDVDSTPASPTVPPEPDKAEQSEEKEREVVA
jgi:hypothetical protein